ncbi:MAG: NADH-quinone oxidoreductase subunit NuoH [Chloroflexi bacterium]|nr:NADH-quinone oxidoreductase subunit NuoH [Chloroflexota bacterium]MDA1239959.1 NADH-quinone oxidoreductase subunit NuoH [Chloroflexota bacterium]MQC25428.1 NADH-quinone oxidoreductase subunit NuoH [Chloroflexota bacterium]MQC48214.1 NADH-quinone oxidoreductase subunit NuoH [Chloroflexota bacterium]
MSHLPASQSATPMLRQIAERPTVRGALMRAPLPVKVFGALFVLGFLALNAGIAYVVIDGRLDGQWYDVRDLGVGVGALTDWMRDQGVPEVAVYLTSAIVGATGVLSLVGVWLIIGPWLERRAIAKFQVRMGPNRNGPFGLFQSLADAIKLMQKEVIIPRGADKILYFIPPVFIFVPALLGWAVVPWAPEMTYTDLDVGVLFTIAISSLGVLAVFLAGWASNNHYSLLGAMRTVAMMVSYEIPISLSLLSVAMLTSSMRLSEIVAWQSNYNVWMIVILPFAAFAFLFSSTAEINRTPNDIGEAESEIVAGFYTEYSGMKGGLFMAVELGNAILVGALMSTFFLGGYTMFGLETWIPGYLILLTKIMTVYLFFVWLRATLPRFRLDQLMGFAWKFLIPISMVQVFVVAIQASVLARVDAPGVFVLGSFAIINLSMTILLVRLWASRMSVSTIQQATKPILTQVVGGLRAAEQIRKPV